MALKTLIFGTDDLFPELQPYYMQEVQRGNLEITAYAVFEKNGIRLLTPDGKPKTENDLNFQLAIISSRNDFYNRMKFLEAQGIPRKVILDGRIFQITGFDFGRFINEGVGYGIFEDTSFRANSYTIYPQIYRNKSNTSLIQLGEKSYIEGARIKGNGIVMVGRFSNLATEITFGLSENGQHNYRNVSSAVHLDWSVPREFYPPQGACKILIGNDVWIGRGCTLKCTNPNKPLTIGDGAVVASDSVVVKNVPPYAIVGGNPAKIIKFRFSEDVIESLLRIKWWDWSLDKIHDNFKYFNDIEKFIALHDEQR